MTPRKSPRHPERDGAIDDAAAAWIVRRQAGLSPAEQDELHRWLIADGRHASAFAELQETWEFLNEPRASGRGADLRSELEDRRRRRALRWRRLGLAATSLAAAATLAVLLWPGAPAPVPAFRNSTVALRRDRQALPDGSTVELNAGARYTLDFTPAKRGVTLVTGEALFSVAKDPGRPFVVRAGGVEIRAVGTAFSVRHAGGEVGVLVTEGRVAVERAAPATANQTPAAPAALLEAGARVVVPADLPASATLEAQPVSPREVAAALAWRDRRVELSGTPLAEVVGVFNRQNRVQLAVPDAALGRHQLSGVFWSDDPEGFTRLLEAGMGVAAERQGDTIVLRRK